MATSFGTRSRLISEKAMSAWGILLHLLIIGIPFIPLGTLE